MNELYPIIRRQRRPLSGTPVAKPVVPVDVCPHCGLSLLTATVPDAAPVEKTEKVSAPEAPKKKSA